MNSFRYICYLLSSLLIGSTLSAAPIIFFGQDLHNNPDTRKTPITNSTNAQNLFLANLVGIGTEGFETFANFQSPPLQLIFPGAGTATLDGIGDVTRIETGTDGAGRYPIAGNQYYDARSGDFTLRFSQNIAAFGFFGIDIGDFGDQLTLRLRSSSNTFTTLTVPHTLGNGTSTDGSVLYFGFYDTTTVYNQIEFLTGREADFFAFDQMTIGSREQVAPSVPEPSAIALMSTGLVGLVLLRRHFVKLNLVGDQRKH